MTQLVLVGTSELRQISTKFDNFWHTDTLHLIPYLTSGVGRLLHLTSAEAISVRPNAHPQM